MVDGEKGRNKCAKGDNDKQNNMGLLSCMDLQNSGCNSGDINLEDYCWLMVLSH